MRLWGGRFGEANDQRVADFTRSIELDRELAIDDIAGSIAHVRGLGRAGLLTDDEVAELDRRADRAREEPSRTGRSPGIRRSRTSTSTSRRRWPSGSGPVAGKLHTGRSRNDQVATDLRLWLRRAIDRLDAALLELRALARRARRARGRRPILPGHDPHPAGTARAVRPSPARLRRDGRARPRPARRRAAARQRLARSARARSPAPATRSTARRRPPSSASTASPPTRSTPSATATSSSRCSAAIALGMVHLQPAGRGDHLVVEPAVRVRPRAPTRSRPAPRSCPTRRTPIPAELVRGRAARVIGALTGVLALLKGLPLAYQRDLQEDKAPLFDAVAVYEASLGVLAGLLDTLDRRPRADAGRGRRGLHDGDGRRRRAGPARHPVPRRPPRRRLARRAGRGGRRAARRGAGLDDRPGARRERRRGRPGARRGRGDRRRAAGGRVGGRCAGVVRRHRRHGARRRRRGVRSRPHGDASTGARSTRVGGRRRGQWPTQVPPFASLLVPSGQVVSLQVAPTGRTRAAETRTREIRPGRSTPFSRA